MQHTIAIASPPSIFRGPLLAASCPHSEALPGCSPTAYPGQGYEVMVTDWPERVPRGGVGGCGVNGSFHISSPPRQMDTCTECDRAAVSMVTVQG